MWRYMPLISALQRQRQADICWVRGQPDLYNEFQDSQTYRERLSQKANTINKKETYILWLQNTKMLFNLSNPVIHLNTNEENIL